MEFFFFAVASCIYFLAVLGLGCCMGFSLVAVKRVYPLVEACRLLTAVASPVIEHRILSTQALGCGMRAQ